MLSLIAIYSPSLPKRLTTRKRYLDNSLAFVEKLLGAKSFDTVIQIQSEYAKTSFEDFVAQSKKIGELYSNLPKVAFKPVEEAIAKSQGTTR
ncbi:MAG: phasin family protein [Methylocella sp.]